MQTNIMMVDSWMLHVLQCIIHFGPNAVHTHIAKFIMFYNVFWSVAVRLFFDFAPFSQDRLG